MRRSFAGNASRRYLVVDGSQILQPKIPQSVAYDGEEQDIREGWKLAKDVDC